MAKNLMLWFARVLAVAVAAPCLATNYYVDSIGGNDANSGTSSNAAWQSLSKINGKTFAAGDWLLLKTGSSWTGTMNPKGSGGSGNPIVLTSYGTNTAFPLINGNGNADAFNLDNQTNWEISNLEVVNPAGTDAERRGIHLSAHNIGQISHLYVSNCYIHNIRGRKDTGNGDLVAKRTGGIVVEVTSDSSKATWFSDIIIQHCTITAVTNQGIVACENQTSNNDFPGTSAWNNRNCSNLIIRNNVISDVAKNAMIIRLADETCLIEHNVVYNTANWSDGNQIYTAACRGTVFQYNEGYLNNGSGAADGSLYDADLRSPLTVWQYSYSHDNAWGLFVDYIGGTDTNVVVRYNISQNDRGDIFAFSGSSGAIATTYIYNNTIYSTNPSTTLVDDRAAGHTNYFYNNIFYIPNATNLYTFHTYNTHVFDYNVFYRNHPADEPIDLHSLFDDPKLVAPGAGGGIGGTNNLNTLSPYKLQSGSPCIDSGTNITTALTGNPNAASVDFFGVAVPTGFKPDRGASEWVNPATPPVLTLLSPAILPNSATLGVQVNPGGATTTSYFAFGTTTNYGSFTATNSSAGTNSLSVSNAVSGLLPGTLYHYRAVATSSVGSINTTDSTFTTLSISQPHLSALLVAGGGNLQINFTNTTGASFTVLSTTNLLAPAVTWPVIGLAMEGPAGQYQFTNPPAGNGQQRFYRVRSP